MKRIYLICLLGLFPLLLFSQELKLDSGTGQYTFTQIINAEGKTKDQLFSIVKEWVALNYKSANSVIQSSDREAGSLVVKGAFAVSEGLRFTGDVTHTLLINFKDNKIKLVATDFAFRSQTAVSGYPFEGNWAGGKKGLDRLLERSQEFCDGSVSNISKYISQSKKDDW